MGNDLTFTQVSTILNEIQNQVTGQKTIANITTTNFVNVAQSLFKWGVDPVINAMTTVLARTIFSVRPYSKKFRGMETTAEQWGAHVRKISYVDKDAVNNDMYTYPVLWKQQGIVDADPNRYYQGSTVNPSGNGESVDQWIIRKPEVLQTNFYGANVYSDYYTVFRGQLFETALKSPAEFGQFWSGYVLNIFNKHNQWDEDLARIVLDNLIASVISENKPERVIHLLTEYNTLTGLSLTPQSVYQAENFRAFILWLNSRIDSITRIMGERSLKYQTVIQGKPVLRNTPMRDIKVYMLARFMEMIRSMVYPVTYHENYIRLSDTESINYWQSIDNPDQLMLTPVYTDTNGDLKTGDAVDQSSIVGVIFDREAAGYATTYSSLEATPWNARSGYYNNWIHKTLKCYNDVTEKAIVLILD